VDTVNQDSNPVAAPDPSPPANLALSTVNDQGFPVVKGYVCDGVNYRLLKSGGVYDLKAGRIVATAPIYDGDYRINKANAEDISRSRIQLSQEAMMEAVAEGASVAQGQKVGFFGGWRTIGRSMYSLAVNPNPKYGRVAVEASRFLMRAAGLEAVPGSEGGGITVTIGSETAQRLLELVQGVVSKRDSDT
jgi:hypothetical protein